MKVTILQTDIQWGNPFENIKQAESLLLTQPEHSSRVVLSVAVLPSVHRMETITIDNIS